MPAAIKAALATGKTIASRSSKVASRRHKVSHTFQFVLTPTRLVGAAGGFYKLKFTRGVKVACSPVREITPSMAREQGMVYSDAEGRMSLLATLYREEDVDGGGDSGGTGTKSGGRASRSSATSPGRVNGSGPPAGLSASAFDSKDAKLSLVRVAVGKKTEATVGKVHFNLAEFARMPSGDTPTTLRLSEKASVELVIGCVYVPSKGRASRKGSDDSSRLSGLSLGSMASSAAATDVSVRTVDFPGFGIKGRRSGGGTTSRAMASAAAAVAAAGGTGGLPPPPPSPSASSTTSSTARKVSFWSKSNDQREPSPPQLPPSSPLTPSSLRSATSSQQASSPLASGLLPASAGSSGRCTAPGCQHKDERIATLTAALQAATAATEAAAARSRLRDGVIRELRERCEWADTPSGPGEGEDMAREGGAAAKLGGGSGGATAADVARLMAERDSLAEALRVAEKAASAAALAAAGCGGGKGEGVAAVLRAQDGLMRENASLRREVDELSAANEELQDVVDTSGPGGSLPTAGGGLGSGAAGEKALAAARARAATLERQLADARAAADVAATRAAADVRAAVAKADCAEASTEAVQAQLADALDALAGARQEADAAHAGAAAAGVAVARNRSARSTKQALADAADAAAASAANEGALRATVEMGQARLAAAKAEAVAARADARAAQVAVEEARGEAAVAKAAVRAEREAVARAEEARVAAEATAAEAVAAAAATSGDRESVRESKKNRSAGGADGRGGEGSDALRAECDKFRAQVRALETTLAAARDGGGGRARRAEAEAARLRETVANLEAELAAQNGEGDRGGVGGGNGGGGGRRPPLPGGVTDERILMELLETKLALASAVEAKLQLEYAIGQVQRGGDRRLAGKLAEHASKLEVRLTAANTELQTLRAREVEAAAAVAAGRVRESRRKAGGKRGAADPTAAVRGGKQEGRKAAVAAVASSSAGGRQSGARGGAGGQAAQAGDSSEDDAEMDGGSGGSDGGSRGGSASDDDVGDNGWASGGGGDGGGDAPWDEEAAASDDGDARLDEDDDEDGSDSDAPPPAVQVHRDRGRSSMRRVNSRVRFASPTRDSTSSDDEG
ncbi:hypothetical protein I4F81_006374 [Pyropia yezoensis]|uniref:Uncharacterized protein n=1 Tax=Pyropia yezoensis TaxID=2788 RepID=A0ACC3C0U4_PYRYE|nr:hypothetical protein I4F81_006374 [Neopyropia yezoensis]